MNNGLLATEAELKEAKSTIATQVAQLQASRSQTLEVQKENALLRQRAAHLGERHVTLVEMVKALRVSSEAAESKFKTNKGDLEKQLRAADHRRQGLKRELMVSQVKLAELEREADIERVCPFRKIGRWIWQPIGAFIRDVGDAGGETRAVLEWNAV